MANEQRELGVICYHCKKKIEDTSTDNPKDFFPAGVRIQLWNPVQDAPKSEECLHFHKACFEEVSGGEYIEELATRRRDILTELNQEMDLLRQMNDMHRMQMEKRILDRLYEKQDEFFQVLDK